MAPVLLSRSLDPVLGVFTGFFAFYLHETHPRTALPTDQRLSVLVRWKWDGYQRQRRERLRAMEEAERFTFSQDSK